MAFPPFLLFTADLLDNASLPLSGQRRSITRHRRLLKLAVFYLAEQYCAAITLVRLADQGDQPVRSAQSLCVGTRPRSPWPSAAQSAKEHIRIPATWAHMPDTINDSATRAHFAGQFDRSIRHGSSSLPLIHSVSTSYPERPTR